MKDRTLNEMLLSLLGNINLVERWWNSPNRAFNLQRPIDVDRDQVRKYLESYVYGK